MMGGLQIVGIIQHDGTIPSSAHTDDTTVLQQGHTYLGQTATIPSTNSPPHLETSISIQK